MQYLVRFLKFVLCIAFTLHALAVIWSAYKPIHLEFPWLRQAFSIDHLFPDAEDYTRRIRWDQAWGMFKTTPNFSSYDARIEVTDKQGNEYIYHPVIPGLKPMPNDVRFINTFIRLNGSHKFYMTPYLLNAAAEIRRKDKIDAETIRLKIYERRIRELYRIKDDGKIDSLYVFETAVIKPARLD